MISRQDIMNAVERDPEYNEKLKDILHKIDLLEGRVFEAREQVRELQREKQKLYDDTYDRIQVEMEGNA